MDLLKKSADVNSVSPRKNAAKGKRTEGKPTKARPKTPFFKVIVLLFSLLVIVAASLGIAALVLLNYFDMPGSGLPAEGVLFTVNAGESATSVARRLQEKAYIRSDVLFRLSLRLKNQESKLKSGTYRLTPELSSSQIQDLLVSGRQVLIRLSIPEGRTLPQIAALIEAAGISPAGQILEAAQDAGFLAELGIPAASLQGYLYPDTYYFVADSNPKEVLRFLVGSLRSQLAKLSPAVQTLSPEELHQKIILASIVEREYRLASEAPLMAGVFYNRLQRGMLLQSCATVVYVITEELGRPHPDRLFNRDLELPSPFNTYKYSGLPPAPICSPGAVALKAVLYPEVTRYLFFRLVDESTGRHYFSENFNEHIGAAALIVKP